MAKPKCIFLYILMAAVLTTGCTGSDGAEDAAARTLGGGFDQTRKIMGTGF